MLLSNLLKIVIPPKISAMGKELFGKLAGINIILDLLDRLRDLERENQWLRAQQ